MNVFISGSRAIDKFDKNIVNALFDELNSNVKILVGDANGVDTEIQRFCSTQRYKKVVVYAAGGKVRNNVGNFPVKSIFADGKVYYKNFYMQKDIAMTDSADYGIVIWDGKSKGSLENIKRLIKQNKPCFVYQMNYAKWTKVDNEYMIKKLGIADTDDSQNLPKQLSFIENI